MMEKSDKEKLQKKNHGYIVIIKITHNLCKIWNSLFWSPNYFI